MQEPDIWRIDSLIDFRENKKIWHKKIRDFGFYNMVIGKLTHRGSPRALSLARQRNMVNERESKNKLYQLRYRFISKQKELIYAECNLQFSGLIDIIPLVFPNSKTAFIIRDGRDWVSSWFNGYFTPFGKRDPLYYLAASRPNSDMFPGDPFFGHWKHLSQFQQICWVWRFHIEYALKTIKKNPHSIVVKYEDLFSGDKKYDSMNDLLKHLTCFPNKFQAEYKYPEELSGKRFHESRTNNFPKWENWSPPRVQEFQQICGDFLIEQGYGMEPRWQEMTKKAGAV